MVGFRVVIYGRVAALMDAFRVSDTAVGDVGSSPLFTLPLA